MKVGDKVLCLETTDKTEEGKFYEISEILDHPYASQEDINNKAIYVDIDGGWQFKLWKHQYKECFRKGLMRKC